MFNFFEVSLKTHCGTVSVSFKLANNLYNTNNQQAQITNTNRSYSMSVPLYIPKTPLTSPLWWRFSCLNQNNNNNNRWLRFDYCIQNYNIFKNYHQVHICSRVCREKNLKSGHCLILNGCNGYKCCCCGNLVNFFSLSFISICSTTEPCIVWLMRWFLWRLQ